MSKPLRAPGNGAAQDSRSLDARIKARRDGAFGRSVPRSYGGAGLLGAGPLVGTAPNGAPPDGAGGYALPRSYGGAGLLGTGPFVGTAPNGAPHDGAGGYALPRS